VPVGGDGARPRRPPAAPRGQADEPARNQERR
jgi:hypothetical protein